MTYWWLKTAQVESTWCGTWCVVCSQPHYYVYWLCWYWSTTRNWVWLKRLTISLHVLSFLEQMMPSQDLLEAAWKAQSRRSVHLATTSQTLQETRQSKLNEVWDVGRLAFTYLCPGLATQPATETGYRTRKLFLWFTVMWFKHTPYGSYAWLAKRTRIRHGSFTLRFLRFLLRCFDRVHVPWLQGRERVMDKSHRPQ